MDIPLKLKDKLPDGSFVYQLLENVQAFLSSAYYFPEYTLHDHRHISAVLELSSQLIQPSTLDKLKPQAVEMLIGAIALHDLGMFIKPAGLRRLVFIEHKDRKDKYLNKLSWNKTWEDFYKKTRRYTDRQLLHLFGDTKPVEKLPSDDVAREDTREQRLLYGEFIRQNHHRLAFDIAEIGFPGDGKDIDVFEMCNCDKDVKTVIGLIAQSHGMKLRDTEEFIANYELMPHKKDIPVFYLMAVLRMADYLHIGKGRASQMTEFTDEMHSPESKRQFHLNQAIAQDPVFDEEHKSVNIIACPDCSSTYEDVEDALHKIQQELDYCWATLAENYAYKYELSIHRLTSNLFDENKITSFNDRFLTHKVALDVNPDIVKHLIGPLYDNNPSYGVRELIQNAVDACNERTAIDKTAVGKIDIHIDTKEGTFEITDNGIGMNEDVLRNYFLVAGSSYRYSDAWREKYITDDGETKIARTGRFGIGALASFLIGDEITVTTKHVDDGRGFQFTFSKEPKTLDVKRVDVNEPGTTIKIKMYEKYSKSFKTTVKDKSSSDVPDWVEWYYFSKPEVCYYLNGKKIRKNILTIPEKGIDKDGWYDVETSIFSHMKLKYAGDFFGSKEVLVNGIFVAKNPHDGLLGFSSSFEKKMVDFYPPAISVIDTENKLDINLKRTKILNFPEFTLTAEETFKYYLANLLALQEQNFIELNASVFAGKLIAVSELGYTLFAPSFICHTKQQKALALYYDHNYMYEIDLFNGPTPPFSTPVVVFKHRTDSEFEDMYGGNEFFFGSKSWNINDEAIILDDRDVDELIDEATEELMMDELIDEDTDKPANPPLGLTLSVELPLIEEYTLNGEIDITDGNISLGLLRKYIPLDKNNGMIPFDMSERKKLYPRAFSELERYMNDSHKLYKPTEF